MPLRRVKKDKNPNFTVLEKDLFLIENPADQQCTIEIPSVQSCICLILWHPKLCAVIHANGHSNEVAAYNYIIRQFGDKNIKNSEVKVYMLGGFYTNYTNFIKEILFWASGINSNAIAHPMLHLLKQHGFIISPENQKQHNSPDDGNFCVTFPVNSISKLAVENSDNESAYISNVKNELEKRNETPEQAFARIRKRDATYQVFTIAAINGELKQQQIADTSPNNCNDTFISWLPRP